MRENYINQLKRSQRRDTNPFEAEDKRIAAENRQQYRRGHPSHFSFIVLFMN